MVDWLDASEPPPAQGVVVTMGSFDGIHLGHQALIQRAVTEASAQSVSAVGLTFHPHPLATVRPSQVPPLIMGIESRAHFMREAGLDQVFVLRFDAALASLTADEFIADVLVARLKPQAVVVGFNFSYGKGRSGNLEHLRQAGLQHGFEVCVVAPVELDAAAVSSTRLRAALTQGDLPEARRLLGRNPGVRGVVIKGDQRGRTLGYPTANINADAELLPKNGVYATRFQADGGARYASVTNIGNRPTFGGDTVRVESHVFNFDGDLYGETVTVECVARIRDEQRFDGPQALKQQLELDCAAARTLLAGAS